MAIIVIIIISTLTSQQIVVGRRLTTLMIRTAPQTFVCTLYGHPPTPHTCKNKLQFCRSTSMPDLCALKSTPVILLVLFRWCQIASWLPSGLSLYTCSKRELLGTTDRFFTDQICLLILTTTNSTKMITVKYFKLGQHSYWKRIYIQIYYTVSTNPAQPISRSFSVYVFKKFQKFFKVTGHTITP